MSFVNDKRTWLCCCYKVIKMIVARTIAEKVPLARNAELGAGAGSEGLSRVGVVSSVVAVSSVPHSNSQKEVVLLHAPANIIAALPEGLSSSSRKIIDSESISPSVRSAYATIGFLVSDAGERWKT